MEDRFAVLVRSAPPAGCRCYWAPRSENFGGDTEVTWVLITIYPDCPIHKWLTSQDYPVATDS